MLLWSVMQAPNLSWGWENEECCGIWQQIYPMDKNSHLDIFKAWLRRKSPFFFPPEALRENVCDYHLSEKMGRERGRRKGIQLN